MAYTEFFYGRLSQSVLFWYKVMLREQFVRTKTDFLTNASWQATCLANNNNDNNNNKDKNNELETDKRNF